MGAIIVLVNKADKSKLGYFTGKTFDTLKHKAKVFPTEAFARIIAQDLDAPTGWGLGILKESRPKNPRPKKRAKKPVPAAKRATRGRVAKKRKSVKRAKRSKRSPAKSRSA